MGRTITRVATGITVSTTTTEGEAREHGPRRAASDRRVLVSRAQLLRRAYAVFNARDIDAGCRRTFENVEIWTGRARDVDDLRIGPF